MNKYLLLALLISSALLPTSFAAAQVVDKAKLESIAVVPWVFEKGTNGAVATAKDFLRTVLLKAGYEVRDAPATANSTFSAGALADRENRNKDARLETISTPKQLLEIGERMGANYVITGRASWNSRSKWIGFGPKTKSDCTVDVLIVDVARKEVLHEATGVKMDSSAKESVLKAMGTVFLTPLFTVVSGGPKTPHEQRAVQLAIAKALDPWLSKLQPSRKIE